MPIKHPFVSNIPDGTDPTLMRPSNWNADHSVTFTQAELSSVLDGALGTITGLLIGRGASLWSPISVGLSGQLLQSQGSLALPQWSSLAASGISVFGTPLINQITGWGNAATILALSIGNNLSLVASTLAAIVSGLSVAGAPLPNQLAGWNNAATVAPVSIGANVSLTNGTLSASGSGASAVSIAGSPTSLNLTGWQNQTTITSIFIGANLSLAAGTLSATGGGSGGGVSVTGSPAAGNLTRWTSGATITNADLAGDVTTSGSTITNIKASVSLAGAPTTNTPAVGNNSTSIATTAFVTTAINNAIAGVNPAIAVQAATTQASDTSGLTYNNGVSGVGATFTGVANTALTVDGFTFTAINQRILVKNDTQPPSGAFNGVYFVSQIQTALVPIILTRALDYDTPSDINNTGAIPVVNGTANGSTTWVLTSSVATIGTDPLTYTQFSLKPSTIITVTGTPSAGDIAQFSGSTSIKTSSIASLNMLANTLASIGPAIPVSLSAFIDSAIGSTRGAILERGASAWGLVAPGTAGFVFTSNGAGADPAYSVSSVAAATSGRLIALRQFTTAGVTVYTPTLGTNSIIVELQGGGGGGAGCPVAGGTNAVIGNGGGGGAWLQKTLATSFSGATMNVGGAGVGGAAGNNPGSVGGITTFISTVPTTYSAGGGLQGVNLGPTGVVLPSGTTAGGAASNGDLNVSGGYSHLGIITSTTRGTSAQGGDSKYGAGGGATFVDGVALSIAGLNGTGFGGGGGGAATSGAGASMAGGSGSGGLIRIWEYT